MRFARLILQPLQIQISACANARQGLQMQRSAQVSRIQPAQGESDPITCKWSALLREV
eukprot:CAMPEP_0172735210 /NCGR_PEP_ID=MMETSP1074-20121228/111967_1 /TAXON_ID=2916 /ORGANISM="Ceratium fusus, Strain PA161109" /LENGTH=57 /DNA_ID=CAMNT_0013564165 /DNA_START=111 /DNA_END=280 /DNA_ORIENTATION=-